MRVNHGGSKIARERSQEKSNSDVTLQAGRNAWGERKKKRVGKEK